jgi:DNA-binding response OmpR family regulator
VLDGLQGTPQSVNINVFKFAVILNLTEVSSMLSKLILLISESSDKDDDKSVAEVVSICLNRLAGWHVISISLIDERLSLLRRQPDAILVNTLLSRSSELTSNQKQIIQSLKSNVLTRFSPIVLLIDTATWLTTHELRSLGISGAIAKPFDPPALVEQIKQTLGWMRD